MGFLVDSRLVRDFRAKSLEDNRWVFGLPAEIHRDCVIIRSDKSNVRCELNTLSECLGCVDIYG